MKITEVPSGTQVAVSKTNRNRILHPDIRPPHQNRNHCTIFSGRPNSGKSNLITHFLKSSPKRGGYNKVFSCICLVMPRTSRDALDNGKVIGRLDENKCFDELNEETCEKIDALLEANGDDSDSDDDEPKHSLVILDDCMSALRNKEVEKWLRNLLANHRHMGGNGTSVWVSTQSYIGISKPCRDLFRNLIQFHTPNKKELARLHEEWCGQMTYQEFRDLFKHCHSKRFSFA